MRYFIILLLNLLIVCIKPVCFSEFYFLTLATGGDDNMSMCSDTVQEDTFGQDHVHEGLDEFFQQHGIKK